MSTPYVDTGRISQKRRTRQALLDGARLLVAEGVTPTVEAAAERAGISRTTAYRYFRNQAQLLLAAHPETAAVSLLPPEPPADAGARLDLVLSAFIRLIVETEPQQRAMLRMSLGTEAVTGLPLRQGRAVGWIGEALAPLRDTLGDAAVDQLTLAIRSATGIEALVWLTDVAGLDRADAANLMRWSATAMLRAAVEGDRPPRRRRASARKFNHPTSVASSSSAVATS